MAFNLNDTSASSADKAFTSSVDNTPVNNPIVPDSQAELTTPGLSQVELNDPNEIKVHIQNEKAPIVVLFGPPTCGKTMTMIRLAHFLVKNGYSVTPVKSFRPKTDTHYEHLCNDFRRMLNSDMAQVGTGKISFMLLEVSKGGKTYCQLLEAPGEHYFNPKDPKEAHPRYLHKISSAKNRKLWVYFIEPDHTSRDMENEERLNYVDKIKRFKETHTSPSDRNTIVYSKIDETSFLLSKDTVKTSAALENARQAYPGLIESFKNQNPITKIWKSYLCDFVPYSNGFFNSLKDGGLVFEMGSDKYPRRLWESIMKSIRG